MAPHGDLASLTWCPCHLLYLHNAFIDLGDLDREQLPDEHLIRTAQHDRRSLGVHGNFLHQSPDRIALPEPFTSDLFTVRQDRLYPADIDQDRTPRDLLYTAGDDLTLTIEVFLKDLVPLGLFDPLLEHLLRGLDRRTTEFGNRDIDIEMPAYLGIRIEFFRLFESYLE